MDLKKYFPFSDSVVANDGRSLVVSLLIYFAAITVARIASFLLGWLILIGTLVSIVCTLRGIYCTLGILLSLLIYFRVI